MPQAQQKNQHSASQSEYQGLVEQKAKLERQKAELLAGFRTQLKLIDVLRRQKVHVETARCIEAAEQVFLRGMDAGQEA